LQEDAADFAPNPFYLEVQIGRENARRVRVVALSGCFTDELSLLSPSAVFSRSLFAVVFLAAVVSILVVVFAVLLGEPGG
jgi:hypothetical protein